VATWWRLLGVEPRRKSRQWDAQQVVVALGSMRNDQVGFGCHQLLDLVVQDERVGLYLQHALVAVAALPRLLDSPEQAIQ
tara:strand:+ start:6254 stop:6493 length:240 start_codon:yes stop_codon:yes gene_type:complete